VLKQKKRFYSIDVDLQQDRPNTHPSWHIHFDLVGLWIFKEIKIKGIWFGRHKYENLYLHHPGEVFDISLHKESIDEMEKSLRERGHFGCKVDDEIRYDKKNKSITIIVTINKGDRFRVENCELALQNKALTQEVMDDLNKIIFSLKRCRYSNQLVHKANERITNVLTRNGLSKHRISIKQIIKRGEKKLDLIFNLYLKTKKIFEFSGNKFFSTEKILTNIVNTEKPEWLLDPNIVAETILYKYYKYGFWSTKIRQKKIGENKYRFQIDEGKRVSIKNVTLKDLETGKVEKNKFFFQEILDQRFYTEKRMENCIEKLKSFYVEHGFWDCTIVDQQQIKRGKSNKYDIIIFIKKGTQRFLDNVTIKDFPDIPKTDFFQLFLKKKGLPFNPSWLTEQRNYLLNHFQKLGHWYVDAQPYFLYTPPSSVSVVWEVDKGARVLFGKLLLRGSTRLSFNRIIKEVKWKSGELWDRKKLDYTRRKLKKLKLFKHIEVHPKKISHQHGSKPVILTLLDDDPLEIKLRTGYFLTSKNFLLKRESTYKLGGSLTLKNPLNQADKLSFDLDVTRFEKNIDLTYQVPKLFGSSANAKFKGYFHKYVHPLEVGKSDSAYEATQYGFLGGISKEYKHHSFWGLNIGNEWMQTCRARGNLNLSQNMINNTIPYFFLEPNLVVDKRDNKLKTKNGSFTFLSIKAMIPYKNRSITYKMMIDRSMFLHFGHNIVAALRIRLGHIFREKFQEIMPIERFFLGGPLSVRGYSKDSVPPLGKTIRKNKDGTTREEYTIQGGSSMLNGNLELRFPIYKSFGGVIFQDIGALSQQGFFYNSKRWAPTSGWGLRYNTPIGAIRFDIGWKWKKSFPKDTSYAWYLTLGHIF